MIKIRKFACILVVSVSTLFVSACQSKEEDTVASQVVNVETVKPSYETITVEGEFVGTVDTGDKVSVYPMISGKIIEKNYEVGDYVNEGDVLFVLDDRALQIEKRNADANVKSAAATLDAQKANSNAAKAAADEAVGTVSTTEFEKAKAYNEASREENAARVSESKNMQQASLSGEDANRAKEQINKAMDQLSSAESYYNHLNEIKNLYTIKFKSELQNDPSGDEEKAKSEAEGYLRENTNFLSYEELSTAVESAKGVIESASAEKVAQEGNYTSSISQKLEACTNAEIERGTIANAQDAKALAQKMFADYELYTKNTLLAEASAKVAEGQANVTISDSQLDSAKAAQDFANLQISYTNVTAPISGIIEEINIEKYSLASDQNVAYVITGQNRKKVSFYVPENILGKIKVGQNVSIKKNDHLYQAAVTRINDSLKQGETLFKIEVAINDCDDTKFIIGTKLKLNTCIDSAENALTVPVGALYYDDGKPYLYVAQNGKAIRKDVEVGIGNDSNIQVISGVDENSQIITSWSSALKDQTDIQIVNSGNEQVKDSNEYKIKIENIPEENNAVDIGRSEQTEAEAASISTPTMIETTDKVNIRKSPDKNGEKIDTVAKGTQFEKISDTENGWTRIKYGEEEAYIKSDYIKKVE